MGEASVRAAVRRSGSAAVRAAARVSSLAWVSAILRRSPLTPLVRAVPRRLALALVRATWAGVEVTIDGYQARSKGKLKFHLKQLGVGIGQGNSKEVGVSL